MSYTFEFDCIKCKERIPFSTKLLDEKQPLATCSTCHKKYSFDDETLKEQLKQFEALCRQIHASEKILGQASVGIDVGDKHVKIPYKLLLTRMTSHLNLMIGGEPVVITLRVEPLEATPSHIISIKK
jgi:hypothetical protein